MASDNSDRQVLKKRYELFHRYWDGLVLACVFITIIGSGLVGSSIYEISLRTVIVFGVVTLLGRIIIKSWATWEEVKRGETQTSRR